MRVRNSRKKEGVSEERRKWNEEKGGESRRTRYWRNWHNVDEKCEKQKKVLKNKEGIRTRRMEERVEE